MSKSNKSKSRGKTYFYVVALFSVGVLLYSMYMLYNSLSSYIEGRMETFYIGLIVGVMGIGLAISSLATLRKRIFMLKTMNKQVLTVELCDKCSFKKVRSFKKGDFINKKVGKCTQCNGDLFITAIFLEDKEGTSHKVSTSHPSSVTTIVCSA